MINTFKFKIYDDETNDYVIVNPIESMEKAARILNEFANYYTDSYLKDNPEYLKRFTGRMSKSGEEVWEGDKLKDSYGIIYTVEWDSRKNDFYLKNEKTGQIWYFLYGIVDFELVKEEKPCTEEHAPI